MAEAMWSGEKSRRIISRIIVEGDLQLQTPAHFGNGDGDDLTDMPLLADPFDGASPLLTGSSIAGAMRSYLRSRQYGNHHPMPERDGLKIENDESYAAFLFGGLRGYDDGEQSPLIVDDLLGEAPGMEMRDGVKIDSASRTAEEDKLFKMQLWQAGTRFPLRFELLVCEKKSKEGSLDKEASQENAERLKLALATALQGFNDGGITLGARKRRGFGRVGVIEWRVKEFKMGERNGLIDWIENGGKKLEASQADVEIVDLTAQPGQKLNQEDALNKLFDALGAKGSITDKRKWFQIEAEFGLNGSLLIRSGGGKDDVGPDMVHLRSHRVNGDRPILPGTSLAGALRARALKIANTIAQTSGKTGEAGDLIEKMFGVQMDDKKKPPKASRVIVEEEVIERVTEDLVQSRVSIDRFTGGARETALFNEQPLFGKKETSLKINVKLLNPRYCEIGMLLLLLKDLWTGDLPLGGEISVGRGRLIGRSATLEYHNDAPAKIWKLEADGEKLKAIAAEDCALLESYVSELNAHLR